MFSIYMQRAKNLKKTCPFWWFIQVKVSRTECHVCRLFSPFQFGWKQAKGYNVRKRGSSSKRGINKRSITWSIVKSYLVMALILKFDIFPKSKMILSLRGNFQNLHGKHPDFEQYCLLVIKSLLYLAKVSIFCKHGFYKWTIQSRILSICCELYSSMNSFRR